MRRKPIATADSLHEVRREAKRLGLPWRAVRDAYRVVKAAEWERRQHVNDVRETAWCLATPRSCWPFWRHGFLSRFGRLIARGADYTAIPGHDLLAQSIASYFPEYAADDGPERLWAMLLSPYDRMPTQRSLYLAALAIVQAARAPVPVPF